jgi:hypothetical protein
MIAKSIRPIVSRTAPCAKRHRERSLSLLSSWGVSIPVKPNSAREGFSRPTKRPDTTNWQDAVPGLTSQGPSWRGAIIGWLKNKTEAGGVVFHLMPRNGC